MKIIEKQVKNIITKTKLPAADYVINPYIGCSHKCVYCYADFMSRFSGVSDPWGSFIVVKDFFESEFNKCFKNKKILLSSVTDAYQPINQKFNKTRLILEKLKNTESDIEILTKSKFLLNDLDLLKQINNLKIGVSLSTLDEEFRKLIEPGASSVPDRLKMLEVLHYEGIQTYLFISPIFPEITDCNKLIDNVNQFVDEIWFENLNLRGSSKVKVLNIIKSNYEKFVSTYKDIYLKKNQSYWINLENKLRDTYKNEFDNGRFKMFFYHSDIKTK